MLSQKDYTKPSKPSNEDSSQESAPPTKNKPQKLKLEISLLVSHEVSAEDYEAVVSMLVGEWACAMAKVRMKYPDMPAAKYAGGQMLFEGDV